MQFFIQFCLLFIINKEMMHSNLIYIVIVLLLEICLPLVLFIFACPTFSKKTEIICYIHKPTSIMLVFVSHAM